MFNNKHMRRLVRPASVILVMATLSACGGGGGSGVTPGGSGPTSLAAGVFTKSFDPTPTGNNSAPFTAGSDTRHQMLYLSGEINGAGYINHLRFSRGFGLNADVTCPDTTIKLVQTAATALGTDLAANVNAGKGSLTTVYDNATLTVTAGAENTWYDVPLATPFYYNGVDNLVVEISRNTGCSDNALMKTVASAGSNRRAYSSIADATAGVSDLGVAETTANNALSTTQLLMQFGFAGGENKVDYGVQSYNSAPLSTNINYQKVQMLYNASAIDGSGPISGIGLQVNGAVAGLETYTYTIKLGHTSLTDLSTDWMANMNVGTPVTVANSRSVTVPAGVPAGGFIWLPVPDGVFNYNGTDNLVVEVTIEAASGNVGLSTHATTGQASFAYGPTVGATANGTAQYVHQIALRFHGGKLGIITDEVNANSYFLNAGTQGRMSLYRASELGTAGTITSVACRMSSATSTATTLDSYKIIMGQTSLDSLDAVAVNNLDTQQVAYDGSLDIPAGLVQGDWITINLTTPFVYNGTDNLVVWMGTTASSAGATTHNCYYSSSDATRYPGHSGSAVPDTADVFSIIDRKADIQLGVTKTQ